MVKISDVLSTQAWRGDKRLLVFVQSEGLHQVGARLNSESLIKVKQKKQRVNVAQFWHPCQGILRQ
jgi:hypothetical protein